MASAVALFLCFLVFATATSSHAVVDTDEPNQSHLLLPTSGPSGFAAKGINCLSWRLGVETHNIRDWELVPKTCAKYIGRYMLGKQYRLDCEAVADVAIKFAWSTPIPRDGRSIWIFDVDETALSNLEYYARPSVAFGSKKFNGTAFAEFILTTEVPALPATLTLYKNIIRLGIKAVFITGMPENFRESRETNLKRAGYYQWEKLVLRPTSELNTTAGDFKSMVRTELVKEGYRIIGNIGDQWSDITGENPGKRTFKLPNPIIYSA